MCANSTPFNKLIIHYYMGIIQIIALITIMGVLGTMAIVSALMEKPPYEINDKDM